jgi:hypothetical protein
MRFMIIRKAARDTKGDARVTFCEGNPAVTRGPFAEAQPLMAGYTMIDAASKEEAVEWVRQHQPVNDEAECEIREVGCAAGLVGVTPPDPIPKAGKKPRYLILLNANAQLESGANPGESRLAAMARRNDEAVRAGVMLAGEGLQPSAKGARVKFSGGRASVTDGPFAETKELIAGFWLIEVASQDEAIEWVKNYPYPIPDAQIDIRQIMEGGSDD